MLGGLARPDRRDKCALRDVVVRQSGGRWSDTVLRGHAKRGTRLLNNEFRIGRLA